VQVDHAGHDPGVAGVDDLVAGRHVELVRAPDRGDLAVLDQDDGVVDHLGVVRVLCAGDRLAAQDREGLLLGPGARSEEDGGERGAEELHGLIRPAAGARLHRGDVERP
jgi:hypothetical protein